MASHGRDCGSQLQIGELSRLTGASPRSLRHYEKHGLLRARRLSNGYRVYDDHAIDRVKWIRRLLQLGLSLRAIDPVLRCVVDMPGQPVPCRDLITTLEAHGRRLDDEIERTTRRRSLTAAFLQQLRREAPASEPPGSAEQVGFTQDGASTSGSGLVGRFERGVSKPRRTTARTGRRSS